MHVITALREPGYLDTHQTLEPQSRNTIFRLCDLREKGATAYVFSLANPGSGFVKEPGPLKVGQRGSKQASQTRLPRAAAIKARNARPGFWAFGLQLAMMLRYSILPSSRDY